jgi:hypothetical protein
MVTNYIVVKVVVRNSSNLYILLFFLKKINYLLFCLKLFIMCELQKEVIFELSFFSLLKSTNINKILFLENINFIFLEY